MITGDPLERLAAWYRSQCDEDWEHSYGVRIDTLDNPGWSVELDIVETEAMGREFIATEIERTEADWIFCRLEDGKLRAACGVGNLGETLNILLTWLEEPVK